MPKPPLTKKQHELLTFIDGFLKGNSYSPSYREIMRALGYKSVSTVATHVDTLIAKGYLQKGDEYSARSLVVAAEDKVTKTKPQSDDHIKWLRECEQTFRSNDEADEADLLAKTIELLDQSTDKTV